MRRVAWLCGIALLLTGAQAEEGAKARWNAVVHCQMAVLPVKSALPLLPDLTEEGKIDLAWAKVMSMVGHGEATLAAHLTARGATEEKLTAESVEELRFAGSYKMPEVPKQLPEEKVVEFLKNWPVMVITPDAFETRKIGAMLEVTVEGSADGKWVSAAVVASHIRLLRFTKFDAGVKPSGERLSVEQPQLSVVENRQSIYLRSGQWALLGAQKVPGDEKSMELILIRVEMKRMEGGK